MFDVVFLIIWILVVLGLVLYLFYWNRVLGFLLSLLVRFLSWNQASASAWIDIGAHSTCAVHCSEGHQRLDITRVDTVFPSRRKNSLQGPTISHQQPDNPPGQRSILWRYWIRKPTEEDDLRHARVGAEEVGRESGSSP
jgi:hypothetical protein